MLALAVCNVKNFLDMHASQLTNAALYISLGPLELFSHILWPGIYIHHRS